MEADSWFVENIEHPRQAAADLAGETDALAFAAAERAAGAVEVQIIEPDIVEKAEPLVDLLQNRFGDLLLRVVQLFFERGEPIERIRHRALRRQADILARALHRERFGAQPRAVTRLARLRGLVLAQFLAHPRAFGLEHAAIEIADDPLERLVRRIGAAPILERQFDRHSAAAIKDDLLHPPAKTCPRLRRSKSSALPTPS